LLGKNGLEDDVPLQAASANTAVAVTSVTNAFITVPLRSGWFKSAFLYHDSGASKTGFMGI
jgi:hypothetical protein